MLLMAMARLLKASVQDVARVCNAVATGDLSQKITVRVFLFERVSFILLFIILCLLPHVCREGRRDVDAHMFAYRPSPLTTGRLSYPLTLFSMAR